MRGPPSAALTTGDAIAPLFNKFQRLSAFPEHAEVQRRIEALASKLGFPLGNIWIIDGSVRSSHSNAFFCASSSILRLTHADGLPGLPRHIVLYDKLVKDHTPEESV